MAKEKKIGVRFYLNDRLKPKVIAGEERYPVYVRITFNRQNLQCQVPIMYKDGYLSEKEFIQATELSELHEVAEQMKHFENRVRQIIRIEYKHYNDKFSFKGFARDLYHYDAPMFTLLENELKHSLIEFSKAGDTLDPDWYSIWAILEILVEDDPDKFFSSLPDKLQLSLKAFVYLSGFVSQRSDKDDTILTALDWFTTPLPKQFSEFLLWNIPIETQEQKMELRFFEYEAAKSIVWECLFFFNIEKSDIPLIIKSLSMTLIR